MHRRHRAADLPADERRLARRHDALPRDRCLQRAPPNKLHPEADASFRLLVRYTCTTCSCRIRASACPSASMRVRAAIPRARRFEQFQRNVSIKRRLRRSEDVAGGAFTQLLVNREAVPETGHRADRVGRIAHEPMQLCHVGDRLEGAMCRAASGDSCG